MYIIKGKIHKPGGEPVTWIHYSHNKMTLAQCENVFSKDNVAGKCFGYRVRITEFSCEKISDDIRIFDETVNGDPEL
ncbi:DUF1187 family protein [Enterobacter hormaechei]